MTKIKKCRGIFTLLGAAAGLVGVARQVRKARTRADKLLLANAVAGGLVALTGLALAVRDMRKDWHK
jgi:hypothetical protein